MPDNKPRLYPGLHAPQRKKSGSTVTAMIIVILVVAGASAGGYWLHGKFSTSKVAEENKPQPAAPADTTPASNTDLAARETTVAAESSTISPATSTTAAAPETSETAAPSAPAESAVATVTSNDESLIAAAKTVESKPVTVKPAESAIAVKPAPEKTVDVNDTPTPSTPAPVARPITALTDPIKAVKEADKLYGMKKFAQAAAAIEPFVKYTGANSSKIVPGVLYRLGLINRQLKKEKAAQEYWKQAYEKFPADPSGRLSALALADTWYYWYVTKSQNYAQWELIRDAYSTVLGMDGAKFLPAKTESEVVKRLSVLNEKLIWDPRMKVSGAMFHTVKPGEYISTIARKYNLDTWTQIPDINHIDPKKIREGMTLKVIPGRLFILIDKKKFTLDAYLDGKFLKRYHCATGAPQTETPTGSYIITKMDTNPTWTDPKTGKLIKYGEPGHPIGTRWLAMQGGQTRGLGIHGTIDPTSIGKKASNGCIRLLNSDVEQLYGFASIQPGNESEVLIIE